MRIISIARSTWRMRFLIRVIVLSTLLNVQRSVETDSTFRSACLRSHLHGEQVAHNSTAGSSLMIRFFLRMRARLSMTSGLHSLKCFVPSRAAGWSTYRNHVVLSLNNSCKPFAQKWVIVSHVHADSFRSH